MNVLWVTTKPPWPPVDGGRLLMTTTLAGLEARGIAVTLVAPSANARRDAAAIAARHRLACTPHLVESSPGSRVEALVRSLASGRPLTVERHTHAAVRNRVAHLVARERFDVVHAEQLQALPQCVPAAERGLPVVLRAQNVESEVWTALAAAHRWAAPLLGGEARRLAACEAAAVRSSAATLVLTRYDAARLGALAGDAASIHLVPAPFPATLPPSTTALAGSPPVVVFGSPQWAPNRWGAEWFVRSVWPVVQARLPDARLHVFGVRVRRPGSERIILYAPPADSAAAFPVGGILAVPSRIASGVRMKILEAWARGIPVVSTPEAALGLAAEGGRELLLAADAEQFARAIAELHRRPSLAAELVRAGRTLLVTEHDPERVADRIGRIYADVRERATAARATRRDPPPAAAAAPSGDRSGAPVRPA